MIAVRPVFRRRSVRRRICLHRKWYSSNLDNAPEGRFRTASCIGSLYRAQSYRWVTHAASAISFRFIRSRRGHPDCRWQKSISVLPAIFWSLNVLFQFYRDQRSACRMKYVLLPVSWPVFYYVGTFQSWTVFVDDNVSVENVCCAS